MFTVGVNRKRSSEARQGRSWAQRSAESRRLAVASSRRAAAVSSICFWAAVGGRMPTAKLSIAGSPSALTSVARACTRWNAGLSSRARLLEWTSFFGPRPHFSPLDTSSSSTTPLAPSDTVTVPSGSCDDAGMKTPVQRLKAAITSGRRTTCGKWGEPISSSPSATRIRLTGHFRPAPWMACRAARNAASGPFWFTAPRPTTTLPKPGLSTSAASNGGEDHSAGSACLTSYMK